MRWENRVRLLALVGCAGMALAIPAIGQDAPESILPPGFGDPVPAPPRDRDAPRAPADLVPDGATKGGDVLPPAASASAGDAVDVNGDGLPEDEEEDGEPVEMVQLQDLPPGVRRSTARVGLIDPEDGGLGESAFGSADGRYLSALLRKTQAPIASRWMSILLRRALLSNATTPASVNGSDWAAERAWLLLRMGEADAARQLVQRVDVDRYTPKMFDVALQASLATADPSGMCPMVEPAQQSRGDPAWTFARAICAALAGESAQASALIGAARSRGPGRGIDGLLAEKVVGAGGNTRRAVTLEWDNVNDLTAWRFGMATSTAAEIPERLLASANPRVLAWMARAPLLPMQKRERAADIAAALGVFSSGALVDFYGALADQTDASEISGTVADQLRTAYVGDGPDSRVAAMRGLWAVQAEEDMYLRYSRLVLTARAAARIPVDEAFDDDSSQLIAAMLAAGLDVQAARWAPRVSDDTQRLGWGLLAVGAPGQAVPWSTGALGRFHEAAVAEGGRRAAFFNAAMAGLGRVPMDTANDWAQDGGYSLTREDAWTRALDRAVRNREPGTVAVLCGLGLQGQRWADISPARLYRVVSALRRVGLAAEARMVSAEALTRA